jgi:hypothetical protein
VRGLEVERLLGLPVGGRAAERLGGRRGQQLGVGRGRQAVAYVARSLRIDGEPKASMIAIVWPAPSSLEPFSPARVRSWAAV